MTLPRHVRRYVVTAATSRSPLAIGRRAIAIVRRYGPTPVRLSDALSRFVRCLHAFGCGATIPIPAAVLSRNRRVLLPFGRDGIEFAVHGYRHVDHTALGQEERLAELVRARGLFQALGLGADGFRAPHLRTSPETLESLRAAGFAYDASRAVAFGVVDPAVSEAYRRGLAFYGASSARQGTSLPRLDSGLVCLPYALPDDEALEHRLAGAPVGDRSAVWPAMLEESHDTGGLLTLGIHPERFRHWEGALRATLARATAPSARVWVARLGEVAAWWTARARATLDVQTVGPGRFMLRVTGPPELSLLARGLEVAAPAESWGHGYRRLARDTATAHGARRPVLGVSVASSSRLLSFLREQGYAAEIAAAGQDYVRVLHREEFAPEDGGALLRDLEASTDPIVRLAPWPGRARSALCVTGDLDAVTLWDYGLALLGR